MVKEFGNYTDNSSDSDFGRDEGTSPSNVPDKEARDDDDEDNDDSDSGDSDDGYEEDPEESDRDKTHGNDVVHEG